MNFKTNFGKVQFDAHKISDAIGRQPRDARKLARNAWNQHEAIKLLKRGHITRWGKVADADDHLRKAKQLLASDELIASGGIIEKVDQARARIAELAPIYKKTESVDFVEPLKVLVPKLQKIFADQFANSGRSSDPFFGFAKAVLLQAGLHVKRATIARALSK